VIISYDKNYKQLNVAWYTRKGYCLSCWPPWS